MGNEGSKIMDGVSCVVNDGMALGKAIASGDMEKIKETTLAGIEHSMDLVGTTVRAVKAKRQEMLTDEDGDNSG